MHTIGIDEAGRGPLAGPVAVGAVMVRRKLPLVWRRGLKDSKQLSPRQREVWFEKLRQAQNERWLAYAVVMVSAREIDRRGISRAISRGLALTLKKLGADPKHTRVLLDGGLRAPEAFTHQTTIIKGDEKESLIALASIAAKVTRDARMRRLAKKYPQYGFEVHKGYGTRKHYAALRTHGLSAIHRRSFCKGLR